MHCMVSCNAPATDSSTNLDESQNTALFTYLMHLAYPDNLTYADNWVKCQQDYLPTIPLNRRIGGSTRG